MKQQRENAGAGRMSARALREAMRDSGERPPIKSADAFWSSFRAHATLHPQYTPAASPALAHRHALRWGITATCALLVMVGTGVWHTTRPEPLNRVTSFEVAAQHEAVLVMDDASSHSTLLWIVGMEENNGDQG
jgi:hypothetical protein